MVQIVSNQSCKVKSANPSFNYRFTKGVSLDVLEEHADKILRNSNFSKSEGNTSPSDSKSKSKIKKIKNE